MSYIAKKKIQKADIAHPSGHLLMHAICKGWSAAPFCISHVKE